MSVENWCSDTDREESKYEEKTCPNATLSTINGTWIGLVSNASMRSDRNTTNQPPDPCTG
jgi:hypothetical protein